MVLPLFMQGGGLQHKGPVCILFSKQATDYYHKLAAYSCFKSATEDDFQNDAHVDNFLKETNRCLCQVCFLSIRNKYGRIFPFF